jgi:hypothetical protein
MAVSPDGHTLIELTLNAHGKNVVTVWDTARRDKIATLAGAGARCRSATAQRDDKSMTNDQERDRHDWRSRP